MKTIYYPNTSNFKDLQKEITSNCEVIFTSPYYDSWQQLYQLWPFNEHENITFKGDESLPEKPKLIYSGRGADNGWIETPVSDGLWHIKSFVQDHLRFSFAERGTGNYDWIRPRGYGYTSTHIETNDKVLYAPQFRLDTMFSEGDEIRIKLGDHPIIETVVEKTYCGHYGRIVVRDTLPDINGRTKCLIGVKSLNQLKHGEGMTINQYNQELYPDVNPGYYTGCDLNNYKISNGWSLALQYGGWQPKLNDDGSRLFLPVKNVLIKDLQTFGHTCLYERMFDAKFQNVDFTNGPGKQIGIMENSRGFEIDGCTFDKCVEPIYWVADGGDTSKDGSVTNCRMTNGNNLPMLVPASDGHPIGCMNPQNITIRYNEIYHNQGGVNFYSWHSGQHNVSNVDFQYNLIDDCATYLDGAISFINGIHITGNYDMDLGTQHNFVIKNNVVKNIRRGRWHHTKDGNADINREEYYEPGYGFRLKMPSSENADTQALIAHNYFYKCDVGLEFRHTDEISGEIILNNTYLDCDTNIRMSGHAKPLDKIQMDYNNYDAGQFLWKGVPLAYDSYKAAAASDLHPDANESNMVYLDAAGKQVELERMTELEQEIIGGVVAPEPTPEPPIEETPSSETPEQPTETPTELTCEEKLLKAQTAIEGLEAQILTLQEEKQAIQADYNTASAQLINLKNQLIAINVEKRKLLTIIEQVKLAIEAA